MGVSYERGTPVQETASPYDPAVGLCLGPYGVPRGVGVSYERGTPGRASLPPLSNLLTPY